jgi:hypothetical protein
MVTALYWLYQKRAIVGYMLLTVAIFIGAYIVWAHFHVPQSVTFESQQQATTSAGVEKAASAAQVPISQAQAAAIASAIKHDADKSPDAVVQTTGAKLQATIKDELRKSGGQFSIVTDSKNSSVVPVVQTNGKAAPANLEIISPNTAVTVNEYNIKAYPARIIQFGGSYREVFVAYSWKVNVPKIPLIAPRGDVGYLGVYGHANFDQPGMSRIGIMLTVPK